MAPSSPASGMDRGEGVAMDAMDEDALSSLEEGGPQKSDERAEQQEPPTPRGRVVLSLCRHDDQVPDKVPTEDDLKLLDLRDALHRRDRKAGRQLARICKSVSSTCKWCETREGPLSANPITKISVKMIIETG